MLALFALGLLRRSWKAEDTIGATADDLKTLRTAMTAALDDKADCERVTAIEDALKTEHDRRGQLNAEIGKVSNRVAHVEGLLQGMGRTPGGMGT